MIVLRGSIQVLFSSSYISLLNSIFLDCLLYSFTAVKYGKESLIVNICLRKSLDSSVAIAKLDFVDPGPDIFTLAREPKKSSPELD